MDDTTQYEHALCQRMKDAIVTALAASYELQTINRSKYYDLTNEIITLKNNVERHRLRTRACFKRRVDALEKG